MHTFWFCILFAQCFWIFFWSKSFNALWLATMLVLPQRVGCNQTSAILVQHMKAPEQAQANTSPSKINVTIKSPVGDISVVTLIRTDTTLDHSQKAEKVCTFMCGEIKGCMNKNTRHAMTRTFTSLRQSLNCMNHVQHIWIIRRTCTFHAFALLNYWKT